MQAKLPRTQSKPAPIVNQAQSALRAAGVRGADLARACGVSEKTASRWLRGECVPEDRHAAQIAESFDVPASLWRTGPNGLASRQVNLQPVRRDHLPSVQSTRALPADWRRRANEDRVTLFARRGLWLEAERRALAAGEAAPLLTLRPDSPDLLAVVKERRATLGTLA